jgi:hypothetical protein
MPTLKRLWNGCMYVSYVWVYVCMDGCTRYVQYIPDLGHLGRGTWKGTKTKTNHQHRKKEWGGNLRLGMG